MQVVAGGGGDGGAHQRGAGEVEAVGGVGGVGAHGGGKWWV